jgi:precorrin-3B synthase
MLLRVRVPGGLVSPPQWTALARTAQEYGDAHIDITARANVQLRGIQAEQFLHAVQPLVRSGLLPSTTHDRTRNIFASPFAGIDPTELLDVRPLLRELDTQLLADAAFAALPVKFGFALDSGGKIAPRLAKTTLALQAVTHASGVRLHVAISGLPTAASIAPEHAVEVMLRAARVMLTRAHASGARAAVLSNLTSYLIPCRPPRGTDKVETPLGVHPSLSPSCVNIVPSVPFGRLSIQQAEAIGSLSERHGGELRLAPWRGIVLGAVPRNALESILAELSDLGLTTDDADGYAHLIACSGITGCTQALADVRKDASIFAQHRAANPSGSDMANKTIALSACAKQCGMRDANIALIATGSGYDLRINGNVIASRLTPEAAVAAVAAHV